MKKTAVLLLMLIYGSATMGATVHLHYCMNEFVGWSLLQNKSDKCGKCGMEEQDKEGCCKDEQKRIKLETDHQKAGLIGFTYMIAAPAIATTIPDLNFQPFLRITKRDFHCHAPPDIGDLSLHVLHCVFLI